MAFLHNQEKIRLLQEKYDQGKLPHCLIFHGIKGLGKASLAVDFITRNLNIAINQHHAHFLTLKPQENKAILIEDIRHIQKKFTLKSLYTLPLFVLIDAVDDLTLNAANSLLKLLEEPHQSAYFFLIAHQKTALLPTLRSRAILVHFPALSYRHFVQEKEIFSPNAPLSEEALKLLHTLSEGSPGLAAHIMQQDGLKLYDDFLHIIDFYHPKTPIIYPFMAQIMQAYALFPRLILTFLYRLMTLLPHQVAGHKGQIPDVTDESFSDIINKSLSNESTENSIINNSITENFTPENIAGHPPHSFDMRPLFYTSQEKHIIEKLLQKKSLSKWTEIWQDLSHYLHESEKLHTDKKQVILHALHYLH